MDFRDNMEKCQEYINGLEEEKRKIQVFQRELPLCLDLVTQAIEACKQQLCGSGTNTTTECFNGHSECSEQTTSDGPVLEEFIPLKRSNSPDDDDYELESDKSQINSDLNNNHENSGKKSDWLRSVQLWNQTPDPPTTQEDHQPKKVTVVEVKRNGNGAFHPFQKENNCNGNEKHNNNNNNNDNNNKQDASTPAASACSSAQEVDMGPSSGGSGGGSASKKEEKGGQSQRKSRRCWSPELHRRFVHALQQLGGSHVATPKQIRDLMKVDGLTNDEVKSHLQKYRLHTRRPSSGVHNNANQQQAPQFVVVGGIWMPPQEYAAVTATTTSGDKTNVSPPNGIYAPIATVAAPSLMHQTSTHRIQPKQQSSQSHCEERASHSEGGARSNSPATSSSTHTAASHAH